MDELDAEILALAGEETKPDILSPPVTTNGRKRSEPPTSASPTRTKKSKSALAKKSSKKKNRRDDSEQEEEESELSEAPESELSEEEERPVTTRSTNNRYASSTEESDEDGVFELYPYEGTYLDATDKARLMAMPEIGREAALAERAQEIERAQQDRHLRTLLRSQSRAAAGNGGNASGGESNGGGITRRSTRTQTMPQAKKLDSKKGKLDEMKRVREERNTRKDKPSSTGDDDERARKRSTTSGDDDDDRVEYANDLYEVKKEEREIDVNDVNKARIGRTGFAKLCDYPGFEEAVIDCFVRVSLFDRDTGKNAYRVAQIKGIVQAKPYPLLEGRRRTDKHLQLVQGKAERTFTMDLMSDGAITEAEFSRFKAQLDVDSMSLPSLSLLRRKANDLRDLDSRKFTDEEMSAMIAKRNRDKVDTVALHLQRERLKATREEAVLAGDQDEIWRINKEIEHIADMQRKISRNAATMDDPQTKLAKHNAAARQRNREEIRKAELGERRRAREAAKGDNKPGSEFYNPFMRVRTKAKVVHEDPGSVKKFNSQEEEVKKATEGVANTTLSGVGKGDQSGTIPVTQKGGKKKGIDDVIASMDFGIDIEI